MRVIEMRLHIPERDAMLVYERERQYFKDMRELPTQEPPTKAKKFQYAGGKKDKGITSHGLILKILSDNREHHLDEIRLTFTKHDPPFAESSAEPALSQLCKQGLVKRVGERMYISAQVPLFNDTPPGAAA